MTDLPKEILESLPTPPQRDFSVLNTNNLMHSTVTNGRCTFGHEMTYEILVTTVKNLRNDLFGRWFYSRNSCPICFDIYLRCCTISRMTAQTVDISKPGVFKAATKKHIRNFKRYYEDDDE